MRRFLEKLTALFWNRTVARRRGVNLAAGLVLGSRVVDEVAIGARVVIPQQRRAQHIALLGRTGTGKSSLLRWFCQHDITAGLGFIVFDIHGELTPALLSAIATEEHRLKTDLSENVIVIDPADPEFSVGMNPLESQHGRGLFVRVLQFSEVLKHRWGLHAFGARTDELLRNALFVLAENSLTLLELSSLLADAVFRTSCMKKVTNAEVRQYFELRFDAASEAMQAVMREPILNKTSAFTADEHFRYVVGQRSTFSIAQAMDEGKWILVNLAKGTLGTEAITLGALFLTSVKHASYERKTRDLFTVFADELQNFVGYGADLETMLAEVRKFGVSVCTANQFLEQISQEMRAAILAIGTHIFFQVSPADAQFVAAALDGGKSLAERLRNLPFRHLIAKSGSDPLMEVAVPELHVPNAPWQDLYERSRRRWARPRKEVEAEIAQRQAKVGRSTREALDAWE
jgi:Helicase HerA, central domain